MTEMSQPNSNQIEPFDFKRWYDEIDDFVSDTAQQLNDINRQLGEVSQWKPTVTRTPVEEPMPGSIEEPAGEAGTSEERLHALRNRLKAKLQNSNSSDSIDRDDTTNRTGNNES